jgi:hypothetical protein
MQERFFILGCQRTGTTLMRLILETHPDIFCFDEIKGYAVLQQTIADELPGARLIGFKIPRWTEQLNHKVLFDEGPEGPCDSFYRGEKLLFMHREHLDTIASMLRLKAGDSNWCEIWVPSILKTKLAQDEVFRTRYTADVSIAETCDRPLVGLAALYWKYKTEVFFSYREDGKPVLPISYEKLVTNPRPVLQSVCSHLGIPFHENLLCHNDFCHTEVYEGGLTIGNTDSRKPILPDSVGHWTRFLSKADSAIIERITGDLPTRVRALFS